MMLWFTLSDSAFLSEGRRERLEDHTEMDLGTIRRDLPPENKNMRWPIKFVVLLGVSFFVLGSPIHAQSDKPAETLARPASQAATEEEVAQLRQEVAEFKAAVQRLVQSNSKGVPGEAHLMKTNFVPDSTPRDAAASPVEAPPSDIDGLQKQIDVLQKK